MLLMEVEEYRLTHYSQSSRPSKRMVIGWIRSGILPGKKQGKNYYVDVHQIQNMTGNVLVDRVLSGKP